MCFALPEYGSPYVANLHARYLVSRHMEEMRLIRDKSVRLAGLSRVERSGVVLKLPPKVLRKALHVTTQT